mgnify:CR=1 FL=1
METDLSTGRDSDPCGGPKGVKSRRIYVPLKGPLLPTRIRMGIVGETAVIEFQVIGWVLIVLFFTAMVGGHRSITNRHLD